jgi:hypothetical protein
VVYAASFLNATASTKRSSRYKWIMTKCQLTKKLAAFIPQNSTPVKALFCFLAQAHQNSSGGGLRNGETTCGSLANCRPRLFAAVSQEEKTPPVY